MSLLLAEFVSHFMDSHACADQDYWDHSPLLNFFFALAASRSRPLPAANRLFPNAKVAQLRTGDAGPVIV